MGIITKVSILCPREFKNKLVFLVSCENFPKLIKLFRLVQSEFAENLSCFEMMDQYSINAVIENLNFAQPLSKAYPFYSLFELSSNDHLALEARVTEQFEKLLAESIILDGTSASDCDSNKFFKLKSYRESIPEGLRKDGHGYKYDVSLPLNVYYKAVEVMRERLKNANCTRICGYGHMGDSNLHFNVTSKKFDPTILNLIEPFLYEFVAEHRGSISAEHGIGMKKKHYLHYSKDLETINVMKQIKQLFDPKSILNPNVLFE